MFVAEYFVIYYDFSKFILDTIFEVSFFVLYFFLYKYEHVKFCYIRERPWTLGVVLWFSLIFFFFILFSLSFKLAPADITDKYTA